MAPGAGAGDVAFGNALRLPDQHHNNHNQQQQQAATPAGQSRSQQQQQPDGVDRILHALGSGGQQQPHSAVGATSDAQAGRLSLQAGFRGGGPSSSGAGGSRGFQPGAQVG